MAENSRIDDLRRRVQKDSASIAFAQLAEELRRAGEYQESVDTCRAGLEIHPAYLSARVTLGRALVELGQNDEAQAELVRVLTSAPENLAAIRGLAEIHHRRGDLAEALLQYRAALLLARNDPDLEETIADLARQVEPAKPAPVGGLTLEHMQHELLKHTPPPPPKPPPAVPAATAAQVTPPPRPPLVDNPAKAGSHEEPTAQAGSHEEPTAQAGSHEGPATRVGFHEEPATKAGSQEEPAAKAGSHDQALPQSVSSAFSANAAVDVGPAPPLAAATPGPVGGTLDSSPDDRATRTVAALEEWLADIHVARAP